MGFLIIQKLTMEIQSGSNSDMWKPSKYVGENPWFPNRILGTYVNYRCGVEVYVPNYWHAILTYFLTYLANILTFYLAFFLASGISSFLPTCCTFPDIISEFPPGAAYLELTSTGCLLSPLRRTRQKFSNSNTLNQSLSRNSNHER